jgi:ABC-type glycerol-3-phosphate transport system substrate-binding protein
MRCLAQLYHRFIKVKSVKYLFKMSENRGNTMKYFKFLILILTLLLLVGCAADESDRIFEEVLQQRPDLIAQEDDGAEETTQENRPPASPESGADDEPPFVRDRSRELHIFAPGLPEARFSFYIDRFKELHPNVSIIVEAPDNFWSVSDMSEQIALNTRLMAEPADIFIPPSGASFEKVVMGSLFADLTSFIHGPRGIDLDNYFTNIFEAAEQQGGLYLLPIHVRPYDAVRILNIELFESIGVNPREFETITIDELLAYYLLIAEANPDRNIELSGVFSIIYLLMESPIYDVDTLTVNVDTPEMRTRFEQAMDMGIGSSVTFTPDAWWLEIFAGGVGLSGRFLNRSDAMFITSQFIFLDIALFLAAEHPSMKFTPIKHTSTDGDVRFINDNLTLSIMRDSPNQDLAWEFIRFILEFDESVVTQYSANDGPSGYSHYFFHWSFPVNRTRFNAQVFDYISIQFPQVRQWMNLDSVMEIDDAFKEASIASTFDFFYDIMSSFNRQSRLSLAVFNSLVYPDIWLLYSGQQSIERTLANIQSRLELYVAE